MNVVSSTEEEEEGCPVGWVNAHNEGFYISYNSYQFHDTAHNEGCFTFLGEETKLTWIDASLACEQVYGLKNIGYMNWVYTIYAP